MDLPADKEQVAAIDSFADQQWELSTGAPRRPRKRSRGSHQHWGQAPLIGAARNWVAVYSTRKQRRTRHERKRGSEGTWASTGVYHTF
jgi:hypothetical protein